jgi:hypothetical protein
MVACRQLFSQRRFNQADGSQPDVLRGWNGGPIPARVLDRHPNRGPSKGTSYSSLVRLTLLLIATANKFLFGSDTEVARHVRVLGLEPHHRDYTVKLEPGPTRKLQGLLFPRYFQSSLRQAGEKDLLSQAIPNLKQLTKLTLVLCDLPHHYNISPFLDASWKSFGSNLQKLGVRGHVEAIQRVITSCSPLINLRELKLEFNDNPLESNPASEERSLSEEIFPRIGKFRTLQSFQICSWSRVNFSRAFQVLGQFPELHTFVLRAPFNKAFQSDPSGLARFLALHSHKLRKLDFRLNPLGLPLDPSIEEPLGTWLFDDLFSPSATTPVEFNNLQELQLYPTNMEHGVQIVTRFAQPSNGLLKSLAVKDRYLIETELRALLDAVSLSQVQVLRINLRVLNADIMDTFSQKMPKLRSLRLFIDDWRVSQVQHHKDLSDLQFC